MKKQAYAHEKTCIDTPILASKKRNIIGSNTTMKCLDFQEVFGLGHFLDQLLTNFSPHLGLHLTPCLRCEDICLLAFPSQIRQQESIDASSTRYDLGRKYLRRSLRLAPVELHHLAVLVLPRGHSRHVRSSTVFGRLGKQAREKLDCNFECHPLFDISAGEVRLYDAGTHCVHDDVWSVAGRSPSPSSARKIHSPDVARNK